MEPELLGNPRVGDLLRAVRAAAADPDLLARFVRDLLTAEEIADVANRWAVARALLNGQSQAATAKELGVAVKTVGQVARWVRGPFATGGFGDVEVRLAAADADESGAVEGPPTAPVPSSVTSKGGA